MKGHAILRSCVPETQKSLITKRTATWCPFCGAWGWDFFENLIEDNNQEALLIAAHYSGQLQNSTAIAITSNFNGISQPRFYVGNFDQGVNSGNVGTKREQIRDQVMATAASSPVVNSGIEAILDEGEVTLNVKTRFFQDAEGEFYVAPYIIEDGVINLQSGQGNDAEHKFILRTSFTDNPFGEVVSEGQVASGTTFDQQFSLTLDPSWIVDNITVAVIIWQKDGDAYNFINTNSTNTFGSPVAVEDIQLQGADMVLSPNVSTDRVEAAITLDRNLAEASLLVTDVAGQQIAQIYQGELAQGQHSFAINKTDVSGNGLYFLSLLAEGKVITRKVIFQ